MTRGKVLVGNDRVMRVTIDGVTLPGRTFCGPDGSTMNNVHVGVQLGRHPAHLVGADAPEARWTLDVDLIRSDESIDFRGPAVQGKRGERFIYLTWGDVDAIHGFVMFRRAKLMLNRIDPRIIDAASVAGGLGATVILTDARGGPRCARVDPPAVTWRALA